MRFILVLLMLAFGWFMLGGAGITASIAIRSWRYWTVPLILIFGSVPVVVVVMLLRHR